MTAPTPSPAHSAIKPVAQHRADAGRDAAPEAALNGALDAQHIDRSDRCRDQNAYQEPDRNDKWVGKVVHQPLR